MRYFLILIITVLTQHNRQKFSWDEVPWSSKSLLYNAFRFYEYLCGRKDGIRPEQYSDSDGVVYSYTLENWLVTLESAIRRYFVRNLAFKIVLVPEMQLVTLRQSYGITPYRFAIVFDVPDFSTEGTGSISFNHTCTGSNPILFVMAGYPISDVNGITAITYNSVSMTLLDKTGTNGSIRWAYSYVLMSPPTGASHAVAITAVGSDATAGAALSYSGAAQSGQPDAHNNNMGSGITSLATSITVAASGCWIIAYATNDQGAPNSFTGTNRGNMGGNAARLVNDSNGTVSTGSNTYTMSWTGSGAAVMVMASFAPAENHSLSLMGVGK